MLESWPEIKCNNDSFANYFRDQWINKLPFWFESSTPFCTTNNGLESHNRYIKHHHLFGERKLLGPFLKEVEEIIHYYSVNFQVTFFQT